MRRQLVGMVAATTSLVLIALLLPMMALIRRFAVEDALARTSLEVQATESVVALRERADLVTFVEDLNGNDDGTRTTVLFADGDAIGPDRAVTEDVERARETGRAISSSTETGAEILVPVTVGRATPAGVEPARPESVAIIRVAIQETVFLPDVIQAWVIVGLLGLGLLVLAMFVADRLARNLVRSVTSLAATAEELESGRLEARAAPQGPAEIQEVGHALNRLAGRITELLAHERESVADISHRLRTPLMALRLDAEELDDPEDRARIGAGVDLLTRSVNEVIHEARRSVREGLGGRCDATAVVRARSDFWAALAEDQGRSLTVGLPAHPLEVRLPAADLEAAVDALLENVFAHTPDGSAFAVELAAGPDGGAILTVTDSGPGLVAPSAGRGVTGAGSTGLGLDIVRRTAEAAGGRLEISTAGGGGARVQLDLAAPA